MSRNRTSRRLRVERYGCETHICEVQARHTGRQLDLIHQLHLDCRKFLVAMAEYLNSITTSDVRETRTSAPGIGQVSKHPHLSYLLNLAFLAFKHPLTQVRRSLLSLHINMYVDCIDLWHRRTGMGVGALVQSCIQYHNST